MATTNITASSAWSVGLEGPADVNLQNRSSSAQVEYAVSSSLPAGDGVVLRPFETHPVVVGDGEDLYVRAVMVSFAPLVAVDA